jgi:NADH-quinone oxidoreductase subunit G
LTALIEADSAFRATLASAQRPLIIIGQGALARPDGAAILGLTARLAATVGAVKPGWNGFSVLHTAAARVGALDLGARPAPGGKSTREIVRAASKGEITALLLLGADEIDMSGLGRAFVAYIGTHGDAGAHRANVVLPGAAYTEKSATYVNTEGRPQMAHRAAFPPGDAREDWAILRALSQALGAPLPFNTLAELRSLMYEQAPHLARLGEVEPASAAEVQELGRLSGRTSAIPFAGAVPDFFLSNPIARASRVMAELSELHAGRRKLAAE